MKITPKTYKTDKIKNYIKNNHIFFLFNGNTLKSYDWIAAEKALKNMNFRYYKIFNKATVKTLDKSIYQKIKTTINGITFFIKPTSGINFLTKQSLIKNFEPLLCSLVAVKLNNKVYMSTQIKNTNSLNYKTNKLLTYQFGVTHLKLYYNISK
jgi:hypothetical protein